MCDDEPTGIITIRKQLNNHQAFNEVLVPRCSTDYTTNQQSYLVNSVMLYPRGLTRQTDNVTCISTHECTRNWYSLLLTRAKHQPEHSRACLARITHVYVISS